MSDYGDDYSDYEGDDWYYLEEEYMVADDLAEHAVQSPPPPQVLDEDLLEDWDRFDYFNDLEYASDGYDDAAFAPQNKPDGTAKPGQKRKRGDLNGRPKKKLRLNDGADEVLPLITNSPVVWRAQNKRVSQPKLLDDNDAESFALLKDWREKMAKKSQLPRPSSHSASPGPPSLGHGKGKDPLISGPLSPESNHEEDEEEGEGGDMAIDPSALMAALQSRLTAAGGPLSGMDPQQLLQFAMRMANGQDDGDDIAGEMADEMLNQEEDEGDDEEAEANLLSWITQQQSANKDNAANADSSAVASTPDTPDAGRAGKRPPTPPSSEATHSVYKVDGRKDSTISSGKTAAVLTATDANTTATKEVGSRKRKAAESEENDTPQNAPKKRPTRPFAVPTAASQARTATSAKTTRSGRKR